MATDQRLSLERIYESFRWYCRLIGQAPLSYADWRKERDKVGEWHDNPGSIISYHAKF